MDDDEKCDVCKRPAGHKCGRCYRVFYCSKAHQQIGWVNHKKVCTPFQVIRNSNLVPRVVATSNIKEGDLILLEKPLIWSSVNMGCVSCLGCGTAVHKENSKLCSKCGLSLCNKLECQNNPSHKPECHYLVQKRTQVSVKPYNPQSIYKHIMTVRCLYQKQFAPDIWDKIKEFKSHVDKREKVKRKEKGHVEIVNFIYDWLQLAKEVSEEELYNLYWILKRNCCEVPITTPPTEALFYLASMFEHNCRANCYRTFSTNGHVRIVAAQPIQKGDYLTLSYINPVYPTMMRQKMLLEKYFFKCMCSRCIDITEFGANFSALICQNGDCNGNVSPSSFWVEGSRWICEKCNAELTHNEVADFLTVVKDNMRELKILGSSDAKKFLEHYRKVLPENNFCMFNVNASLAQIIGKEDKGELSTVSDADLKLKKKLCEQVIQVIQTIAPAEKGKLGILLYEQYIAMVEIGDRLARTGFLAEFAFNLRQSYKILSQAVKCLKDEPNCLKLKESNYAFLANASLIKLTSYCTNFERTLKNNTEEHI